MSWKTLVGMMICGLASHSIALAGTAVPIIGHRISTTIVVADSSNGKVIEAAGILQQHLYRMSGRLLPIETVSEFKKKTVEDESIILIGRSPWTDAMGIQVEQNAGTADHYVIRTDGPARRVALVGNDAGKLRSTILAVYDLLWRLGFGWYGPDPLWQVTPKSRQVSIPTLDLDVRPAFGHRSIWLVTDPLLRDAWRLGGVRFGHGHALKGASQRAKYEKDHPDWYGSGQPSLTHPQLIQVVAQSCRDHIDKYYPTGIASLSLSANDGSGFARRDRWAGNVSSQMLYFANAVAKELAKTHPNRYRLTFYAYWYGHDAPVPPRKAEPGVCVMQVNEGDHLKPWDHPEPAQIAERTGRNNTRERNAFDAWSATGAQMAIYEWWIPGVGHNDWKFMPWYPLDTTLRNYRYWQNGRVGFISHETKNERSFVRRWPLYYIGARGMWQPDLTVEQILRPACKQLFGPAAEHMYNYYRAFEKATLASELSGENWRLPSPELIYTPGIESEATEHLRHAAKAARDQTILARIAEEQKLWDETRTVLYTLRHSPRRDQDRFFQVYLDGRRMRMRSRIIRGSDVHGLFGFDEYMPVYVILSGGDKRLVNAKEKLDLAELNHFSLVPRKKN